LCKLFHLLLEIISFSYQIVDIKSIKTLLLGSNIFTDLLNLHLSFTQLETVGQFTLANLITQNSTKLYYSMQVRSVYVLLNSIQMEMSYLLRDD